MTNLNDMVSAPVTPYETVDYSQVTAFVQYANQYPSFAGQIRRMNQMYFLPINDVPHLDPVLLATPKLASEEPSERIGKFINTLNEEIKEGDDIKAQLALYEAKLRAHNATFYGTPDLENAAVAELENLRLKCLTDLTDWFCDIQVYCRSEALKFGLPHEEALTIIMASNFSKLGADGEPIINENGKFEKGPNFRKPEPFIQAAIVDLSK